jgi:hypothetical protein
VLICGCPRHPRIPIAKHPQLCDSKQSTRVPQLLFPNGT